MNWNQLLSAKRFGLESWHGQHDDDRSEFQRDNDRLIFSAPFRRLQNKTQVFPLPGSVFVHNRLTHSLEVASVGRSLGVNAAQLLAERYGQQAAPYLGEIGSIVSAACLAHDMGNPPFGHSGEKAIATYFSEGAGQPLVSRMTPAEWCDLTRFEGNANAFRLLTHRFNGRRPGGFVLTYSTLASVVKYPYAAEHADPRKQKFGFFVSERESYRRIADELGIVPQPGRPERYARHPLVYLVEAADDICYQLMDIEDAHKLRLLSDNETRELFLAFFEGERRQRRLKTMEMVTDVNEQIAYLRSSVIGQLVRECVQVFVDHESELLDGTFSGALMKHLPPTSARAYEACSALAVDKIYRSTEVLDVELGGYKIMLTLLDHLVEAVLNPSKAYSRQLLMRIPQQYETDAPTDYGKVMAVLDYVSGMTDVYALDLYRKITGMSMPSL